jgi:DNA helicase-2/ATP-dependent DNA helicase PcrA
MFKVKPKIIVGPPGTGKTTRLIAVVENLLNKNVDSSAVCYVAFTRKAANEARDRAVAAFPHITGEFKWFRTLHSFAFRQCGFKRNQVMTFNPDYLNLAKRIGMSISNTSNYEDGTMMGLTKGDRMLFYENLARVKGQDLRALWKTIREESIDILELEQLRDAMINYKKVNDKYDYTDMIVEFNKDGVMPEEIKHLIVDEAQDLSHVQWQMVEKLGRQCETIHIAGDDDQAIYKWAGADVDTFINLEGNVEVLDKSWRLPKRIVDFSQRFVTQIHNRRSKSFHPHREGGEINWITSLEEIDPHVGTGTWLIIARNKDFLDEAGLQLQQRGFLYSGHASPLNDRVLHLITSWEKLVNGENLPAVRSKTFTK